METILAREEDIIEEIPFFLRLILMLLLQEE